MSNDTVRVYVNDKGVSLPRGATALEAVRALHPDQAMDIDAGRLQLADSRGLPTDATRVLVNGDIFRVIAVRNRVEGTA